MSKHTNKNVAIAASTSIHTVIETVRKFCTYGLTAAITPSRNPNSNTAKLNATEEVEDKVIAKASTASPKGYVRMRNVLNGIL